MSFDDDWEKFEAQQSPKRLGENEVSLTKTNIVISEQLYEKFQVRRVMFEFCRTPRTIMIRPAAENEVGYVVSYRSVSSRSFYIFFDITERGHFQASIQDGGIVVPLV